MGIFFKDLGPLGWTTLFVMAYWKHIVLAGTVAGGLVWLGMRHKSFIISMMGAGLATTISIYLGTFIYFMLALRHARAAGFLRRLPRRQ